MSMLGQGGKTEGHLGNELAESSLWPRHWLGSEGGLGTKWRAVGRQEGPSNGARLPGGPEPLSIVREVGLALRTHQCNQRVLNMGFRDHMHF